jgi:hypothetical protein
MATYKADHLKEMIRGVVREEIRGVVANVIAEVLSERYLKQLVESAAPRVNTLSIQGEEPDDEDDNIPHALSNNVLGVGQENPVFKKTPKQDHVRQFGEGDERNDMLSLFFEGTKPIKYEVSDSDVLPDEVPIPMDKPEVKQLTETWVALAQGIDSKVAEKRGMNQKDPEAEAARIKKMREALDAKVVG